MLTRKQFRTLQQYSNPWPHGVITAVFIYWEQANSWSLSYSRERFSEDGHIFRRSNFGIRTHGLMALSYYCGVHILGAGQFVEFILLPWKIFWRWSYLPSFKFWDSNPWPHGAKLLLRCSYIGSRPIRGVYLTPVKDFLKMILSSVIQICISAVYIIFTIKWWCNG